jgi:hypothetical protein
MASVRENIANDIIAVLEAATDPVQIKFVTRQPADTVDLSDKQYPAVFVRTGQEDRTDESMNSSTSRFGRIDYTITGFVKAEGELNMDTERNRLIETIEEALEVDRKRNNLCMNSLITNVTTDEGDQFPVARIDINYQVLYKYTRGTT